MLSMLTFSSKRVGDQTDFFGLTCILGYTKPSLLLLSIGFRAAEIGSVPAFRATVGTGANGIFFGWVRGGGVRVVGRNFYPKHLFSGSHKTFS